MIKLSILIPCLYPRDKESLNELLKELEIQCGGIKDIGTYDNEAFTHYYHNGCEAIVFPDKGELSIGTKRQWCLEQSKGKYVCYIDSDDKPSKDYVKDILQAIESKPDCVSLRGVITWDGANPEIFEHSLRYPAYVTHTLPVNGVKYERYPNHLNTIKASIAKQFKFPEINFGEDSDWAKQIHDSGLIETEVYIDKVLYHYLFKPNK